MKRIKSYKLEALLLVMLWASIAVFGQQDWEKKPYQQWSYKEVSGILVGSPWSKMEENNEDAHGGRGLVNIRLHSALPLRQALVRRKQLFLNYDQWTAADKAKFDATVQDFLACPGCASYYILTYRILRDDEEDKDARRKLRRLSLADLQPYVFLINDKGERRPLAQFIPPDGGNRDSLFLENAVFFFERVDEKGKPLLTKENKKFYFQIDAKAPHLKFLLIKKSAFTVADLIHAGEIVF